MLNANISYVKTFREIQISDIPVVGGKNASIGEMIKHLKPMGINIPDGFATTAMAFQNFLEENNLIESLRELLKTLDKIDFKNLNVISDNAKAMILKAELPDKLKQDIIQNYRELNVKKSGAYQDVAVRSSATAEDLPNASFAGQHDSFLNVQGEKNLLDAIKKCFASLYNARAIKYRIDSGFEHDKVSISAGIQLMVRSDLASSGVCFTIDPESGFRKSIVISSCWGLGENIVQGTIVPDEFHVFKPILGKAQKPIINRKMGSKTLTMIFNENGGTINMETPLEKQGKWTLEDPDIQTIATWACKIEEFYKMPMDIEWAKDGINQNLYIVQARPETVHSQKDPLISREYTLKEKSRVLAMGNAVGNGIISGIARFIESPSEAYKLNPGEIIITETTNPDWDPILKKAAAIVSNKGGRTSHAAIVAREIGALAIVGTGTATSTVRDGQMITIDNSHSTQGFVYDGELKWQVKELNFRNIQMPHTKPMLILADPGKAYHLSFYPNQGVGLMRMEFVISNSIRIHPMALVHFDNLKDDDAIEEIKKLTEGYAQKTDYFIDKLSQAIATISAAFYPKEVIVRMSDFKSNEYSGLIGGQEFEMEEENPMIGFRGASRYYSDRYRDGFRLECEAIKVVRNEMGLTNVKLMIPFCRTPEEGLRVIELMDEFGLKKGERELEIYVMIEIPSNVILADEFAKIFDGFSIGSNDLTQLTLGIDRDSDLIGNLFDENNQAVKTMIKSVIETAKKHGTKIGLCGQAPSDYPQFADFLVKQGIDSISFNPDALLQGIENINHSEKSLYKN